MIVNKKYTYVLLCMFSHGLFLFSAVRCLLPIENVQLVFILLSVLLRLLKGNLEVCGTDDAQWIDWTLRRLRIVLIPCCWGAARGESARVRSHRLVNRLCSMSHMDSG